MRTSLRLPAALAAGIVALAVPAAGSAGAATRAASGPHWAKASTATIHPGVIVTIADVKCIAGFVMTDGRRVFLAVPASCSGVSGGTATDGCVEAQVPVGVPVKIKGARYEGTLAYSSFTRMQLHGESNSNRCHNNSLALVRLDRRDIKRTNPSIPVVGGPTGLSRSATATPDQLTVVLGTAPTTAQAISTTSGGWAHSMLIDGSVNASMVGSPALADNGKAVGMVSVVPMQGGPGETTVSDLYREIRQLHHAKAFTRVHLAKGTAPFVPPSGLGL